MTQRSESEWEAEIARLQSIIDVLVARARRSGPSDDAFALFQASVVQEEALVQRTASLEAALSALQRTNAELVAARRAAEDANEAKSAFLATMSHEIRTPMNGVMGALSLLEQTHLHRDQRELVVTMRHAGDHLLRVVNDVLDYSRIAEGRLDVRPGRVVLAELVGSVIAVYQPIARAKDLVLERVLDDYLPRAVQCDGQRLRQILSNLIDNALKFTERGAVRLLVRPAERPGFVHFAVADSGIGIHADQLERVFESFHQADPSSTRSHGGSGLGLAIVKGIAEAMGGHVRATSAPGEGSRFEVELPLPAHTQSTPAASAPTPHDEPALDRELRVLVAEDDALNRNVLAKMLRRMGARAEFVEDGIACLARLEAERFDLVFMDWRMNGMDGLQTTRRVRALNLLSRSGQPVPIVAVTANALERDREQCRAAGMDGFVAKPYGLEDIRAALTLALPPGP